MKKKKNDSANIGLNIKKMRIAKGFTQMSLSEKTGISPTQISSYENNKKNVGLYTLATFANALGCTIDDLYYGSETNRICRASSTKGELLVKSIVSLWEKKMFGFEYYEYFNRDGYNEVGKRISVLQVSDIVEGLICKLEELKNDERFYSDSEKVKQQYMTSAINKINNVIKEDE